MADLVLGLDVGANSIGWALIDEDGRQVVRAGVRVFPEGVARDQQGGEKSKCQDRRTARGMRRQVARRARRRRLLRKYLAIAGLLPTDDGELRELLAQDPYELRRRALDERIEPFQLGRIILHLGQRRGFLSNRRSDRGDENREGLIAEMNALAGQIQAAGCRTLGEYLAGLRDPTGAPTASHSGKVRGPHTKRSMYEEEFDAIWSKQRSFYPDLLSDGLKYGRRGRQVSPKRPKRIGKRGNLLDEFGVFGLLFFQRTTYWPQSVLGKCELEPREKRCPRAARIAQRFRILQEVNNLRLLDCARREERVLTHEQRARLVAYLSSGKERTFDQIRKHLGLLEGVRFNYERGDREKLQGNVTDALLSGKKGVGRRWNELSEPQRDAVVDVLLDEEEDEVASHRRLVDECAISPEEAARALALNLPEGHMNFSRVAMQRLVPHLERGLTLMADDATNSALHAAGYLRPDQLVVGQRRFLPPPPQITNPIVRQAAFEVRKLVNAVLRELVYPDTHRLVRIHVELAREAKKSFNERLRLRVENARRRSQRERAKGRIEEYAQGVAPSSGAVTRYRLWEEQGEFCVYCGQKIGVAQLFNGDADLDHVLPRWRSLDDSLANKVLVHRDCNQEKGDRSPYEWLAECDPERYERVLLLASRLPYGKQLRFQQKEIRLDDFVQRQLTDTAYISRTVSQYLQCLGATIVCPRGQMTSELRYFWGLNEVLSPTADNVKNRADHRHHAIDAVVLAMTTAQRLHALANGRGDVAPPWAGFREQVASAVKAIRVSHRARRRISGALHEETLYGPTDKTCRRAESGGTARPWAKGWIEDPHRFVRRKPVMALANTRELANVRDAAIRTILEEHLRGQGIDPSKPAPLKPANFTGEHVPRMPSGVPILRVRLIEDSQTIRAVSEERAHQCVKPGSNHHITYFAVVNGDREVWKATVATTLDVAQRAAAGQPLVAPEEYAGGRFLMSLAIGEAFEFDGTDGHRQLCIVRKLDQRSKRVYYRQHDDARPAGDLQKELLYFSVQQMQQRNARKVTLDLLGRVRRAGD